MTNNQNENQQNENVNVVELQTITPKYRGLLSVLITFGVCFVTIIFLFQIVLKPIKIEGISMQPTINVDFAPVTAANNQDLVYYNKTNNYSVGDIVIINNDFDNDTIIKRVIATGGQTITFKTSGEPSYIKYGGESQHDVVNLTIEITSGNETTQLKEDYINESMIFQYVNSININELGQFTQYTQMSDALKSNNSYSITLPENTFFCMGDNRSHSYDSRHFGYFSADDILGEMILHVPHGRSIFYALWHKIFG